MAKRKAWEKGYPKVYGLIYAGSEDGTPETSDISETREGLDFFMDSVNCRIAPIRLVPERDYRALKRRLRELEGFDVRNMSDLMATTADILQREAFEGGRKGEYESFESWLTSSRKPPCPTKN